MKFGKYLARRQLDLPEYSNYFMNYKALKKLIKSLSVPSTTDGTTSHKSIEKALQQNRSTFFFQLERELEKVNTFYLQKEAELKLRLEILCQKKAEAYSRGELTSKKSVTYISLYEGFQRFRRDLERLEQFIELNGTGFSKVLKKWDKRSKSHTKEMYLSRAVEIQPVFHREKLANFSDLVASSVMELEAWADGDTVMFESSSVSAANNSGIQGVDEATGDMTPESRDANMNRRKSTQKLKMVSREKDDLFHEFIETASGFDLESQKQETAEYIARLKQSDDAKTQISRIFLLALPTEASDDALLALYDTGLVDLHATDEISGKNCLHRAVSTDGNRRTKIIELALEANVNINLRDVYGKVPLHYACQHNRRDLIPLLAKYGADLNALDKDNFSPLLYAIVNKSSGCVADLVRLGARVDVDDNEKDYIPLNMACQFGVYDAVKILLEADSKTILPDAEGLYPIHLVARAGHAELVPLLKSFGVNIDEFDKLNQWTALFYAASEGHYSTVEALLQGDADYSLLDENGHTALFYAAWEGRSKCLYHLSQKLPKGPDGKRIKDPSKTIALESSLANNRSSGNGGGSVTASTIITPMDLIDGPADAEMDGDFIDDTDAIPDLSLPPPIIPLRRYGHNFLDKKIVLQLMFDPSSKPIRFFKEEDSLPAGRLTLSTRNCASDIIPRSLILPVGDADKVVTFQIDSIEDFSLDFEVFSTFGTRVIGKTTALPAVFASYQNTSLANRHIFKLPLFDMRLAPIGEVSFRFQVVKPFQGKPLEITKYDTYWKSTSQVGHDISQEQQQVHEALSFVTASSLSGKYARVSICLTGDFIPVVTFEWAVKLQGIKIPVGNLQLSQLLQIDSISSRLEEVYAKLERVTNADEVCEIFSNGMVVPLEEFFRRLPTSIKLDIEVKYPTPCEMTGFSFGLSSFCELNQYVDHILTVVFNHAREVRKSQNSSRSLVFTSANPDICTVLNWKQPNYPVFFDINALRLDGRYQTAHGLMNAEQQEDRRCISLKDGSSFASTNNLLGIICSSDLLDLVPSLVSNVRVEGLVLVSSSDKATVGEVDGVDGYRTANSLTFKQDIDM